MASPNERPYSIGPELGTVSPEQVKEAAKEAVHGIGFDLLIVCGFAFDPHVSEEAKRYGNLTVLPTHMNPDLAMGDELLKKTGAGNLFMVFGEPDLDIKKKDGKITVHLKGLDVYDPTTGEIRSNYHRRHRLLVHRYRLQRRILHCPPRLFHRRRRTLRQTQTRPAGRDRRIRLERAVFDDLLSLRETVQGQDRGEGDQSLWG